MPRSLPSIYVEKYRVSEAARKAYLDDRLQQLCQEDQVRILDLANWLVERMHGQGRRQFSLAMSLTVIMAAGTWLNDQENRRRKPNGSYRRNHL